MLRAVLRPAPLALLALALGLATGFAFLGQWQLGRSQAVVQASPALERPRPLADVLAPAETFRSDGDGQVVTASGRFGATVIPGAAVGADGQVLVAGRDQDGRDGSWVVAPFRVDGTAASGGTDDDAAARSQDAVLPVVLGWVSPRVDAAGVGALPPPPAGEVALTGRLLVGEPPEDLSTGPDGAVLRALAPADLVNVWDARLYTGFVIASEPAPAASLEQVSSAPPLRGTDWRSFSYALQWWLFAGFAVFFWWRVVRERFLPDASQQEARAAEAEDRLAALEARRARERQDRPPPDPRTDPGPAARPDHRPDPVHDHVEAR